MTTQTKDPADLLSELKVEVVPAGKAPTVAHAVHMMALLILVPDSIANGMRAASGSGGGRLIENHSSQWGD